MATAFLSKLRTVICALALAAGLTQTARADGILVLSDWLAKSVEKLTADIQARFPPSEYHYVGLGTSPSLITAAMQARDPASASNIPMSRVAGLLTTSDGRRHIDPALRNAVLAHLDRYLPSSSNLHGKKILVIDYAAFGNTINAADVIFQEWARERSRAAPEFLALTDDVDFAPNIQRASIHRMSLAGYLGIQEKMADSQFQPAAEYGSYDFTAIETTKRASAPAYLRAVEYFRSRLNPTQAKTSSLSFFPEAASSLTPTERNQLRTLSEHPSDADHQSYRALMKKLGVQGPVTSSQIQEVAKRYLRELDSGLRPKFLRFVECVVQQNRKLLGAK